MPKRHPRRTDEEWMNLIQKCRSSRLSDQYTPAGEYGQNSLASTPTR